MLARALGLSAVVSAAACAAADPGSGTARPARPPAAPAAAQAPARGARWFHGAPEEAFWVTHDPGSTFGAPGRLTAPSAPNPGTAVADRVVAGGARLELGEDGRVVAAAWEGELWATGEPILGSIAAPPHLGGGYLHWTKGRVLRSREFTGALAPVALGAAGAAVRGARAGLRGVVVFTEEGPREVRPGEDRARFLEEPGSYDLAALDGARAVRVDVLGRAAITTDGGKTWVDVARRTGTSVRGLVVSPASVALDTWLGKVTFGEGGALGPPDGDVRPSFAMGRPYQIAFTGTRAADREDLPWGFRETTPLASAVLSGATLPDGSALALAQGGAARVDLATGRALDLTTEWVAPNMACAPQRVDDGVLVLCTWEDYQGYGGYALRSERGEPPRVERAFSDDGYFVADDRGAVAFVGACQAAPRAVDDEERASRWGEITPKPVACVRRGPRDWVERAVEPGERRGLLAWVPRKDGTAIALVRAQGDPLPEPAGAPRVVEESGVRVVRVAQELPRWFWTLPSHRSYNTRGGPQALVDKRFQARDDGGVDGWLSSTESAESYGQASLGITIDAAGALRAHPLPPDVDGMVTTGRYGVAVTAAGDLYETVDHGRLWRGAGRSPVPPSALVGGCSELGCALGPVVRLGWGAGDLAPAIAPDPHAACRARPGVADAPERLAACVEASRALELAEPPPPLPVLSCAPAGLPSAVPSPPAREGFGRVQVETPWGAEVVIVREAEGPEPEPQQPWAKPGAAPPPPPAPAPPKPGPAAAAPLRTHSLVLRAPFDPSGAVLRLNATNLSLNLSRGGRRILSVPLLGPKGDVGLLLVAEGSEMLVAGGEVRTLPAFEPRRYGWFGQTGTPPGLLIGEGRGADGARALVLGETRRRASLEEHGPEPLRPPTWIGLERDQLRKRPMALARRDDGAAGILILDGSASEVAGVAPLDRTSGAIGPLEALAPWSSLTAADDPRCRAAKGAWQALLVVDPSAALRLDARALPGVSLTAEGLLRVRWGRERVCLEAVDLVASDTRRRADASPVAALVARWGAGAGERAGRATPAAALRSPEALQALACTLKPPAGEAR